MTLDKRIYWVLALVAVLALGAAAVTMAARITSAGGSDSAESCDAQDDANDSEEADKAADTDNIDEQCGPQDQAEGEDGADEAKVASGQIDDGKDLLPQASITLGQAIAAAQTAASGDVGEIDLEHYQGKLAFNVEIGKADVKVDAATGAVLGMGED
ncbi:MAG TPA: PepSY domain-containing protein [Dehalococcoidia bacterium]|nr:PepSY domain-containing protein [Dehalococcoidia bacterium]